MTDVTVVVIVCMALHKQASKIAEKREDKQKSSLSLKQLSCFSKKAIIRGLLHSKLAFSQPGRLLINL